MIETTAIHVLLVDDQPVDRDVIGKFLNLGFRADHFLYMASRLAEAQTRLMTSRVDLILLNLDLPDSGGLETLRRIRTVAPSVPVIVLAGDAEQELALQAVRAGAQDYVLKSRINPEALVRLVRFTLERHRRILFERELSAANDVQRRLYPTVPPNVAEFDIAGASLPAGSGCGDYFDYLRLPTGEIGLVIGDVSGHGMAAALRMVEVRAYLRSLVHEESNLSRILNKLNRYLLEESANAENESGQFVTFFLAALDPNSFQLRYASAGHAAYLILDEGRTVVLKATGLPLGIAEIEIEEAPPIQLSIGDVLLIPTDGIAEASGLFGELFGRRRLLEFTHSQRAQPADQILKQLFQRVRSFIGEKNQSDDITAIMARIGPTLTAPNVPQPTPESEQAITTPRTVTRLPSKPSGSPAATVSVWKKKVWAAILHFSTGPAILRLLTAILASILLGMGWGDTLPPHITGFCKLWGLCGLAFYFSLELVADYRTTQQRAKLSRSKAELRLPKRRTKQPECGLTVNSECDDTGVDWSQQTQVSREGAIHRDHATATVA